MNAENFDVIVVGAGVCGALMAYKLSPTYRVLIIEAGPDKSDRIMFAGDYARNPNKNPASPYKQIAPGYILGPDADKNYFENTSSNPFKSTFLRLVGGSTWHFLGNVPRFIPSDFELNKLYQLGNSDLNWPISYSDIESFYCEAEKELGVSGDHDEWDGYLNAFRSQPYPMNKIWQSYGDQFFLKKINGTVIDGREVSIKATPQARNSTKYDGRPACAGNSSCVPICPIQAKYDATVHVKKAKEKGAVLLADTVVSLMSSSDNGKIVELTCVNTHTKEKRKIDVSNKIVVLATHAIETPRLLLNSGLANMSQQVGKNLMDHLQNYGLAIASEPVYPFRGPITTSGIDAFRDGEHRKKFAAFRMSIGNDGWGRTEAPSQTLWDNLNNDNFGETLRKNVRERITKMIRISYSTEMLPKDYNNVSVIKETDELGIPKAKISFQLDDYNKDALRYAHSVTTTIFNQLGWESKEREDKDIFNYSGAGHIVGTTRMGNNAASSVVNSFGQSHQHPNLFIAGPGIFVTSGTANPTLTAAALTLRTADRILFPNKYSIS